MPSLFESMKNNSVFAAMLVNFFTKSFSKVFESMMRFSEDPSTDEAVAIATLFVLPTAFVANFMLRQNRGRCCRASVFALMVSAQCAAVYFDWVHQAASSDHSPAEVMGSIIDVVSSDVISIVLLVGASYCINNVNMMSSASPVADQGKAAVSTELAALSPAAAVFTRLLPYIQLPLKMTVGVLTFLVTIALENQHDSEPALGEWGNVFLSAAAYGGGMWSAESVLNVVTNIMHPTASLQTKQGQRDRRINSASCGLLEGLPYAYFLMMAPEMSLPLQILSLAISTTAMIGVGGVLAFVLLKASQYCRTAESLDVRSENISERVESSDNRLRSCHSESNLLGGLLRKAEEGTSDYGLLAPRVQSTG